MLFHTSFGDGDGNLIPVRRSRCRWRNTNVSTNLESLRTLLTASRGKFLLVDVAMAMHERKVALTWAPSFKGRSTSQDWIKSQLEILPSVPTAQSVEENLIEILEFCLRDFRAQYSNVATSNLLPALTQEISRDLQTFQRQQWITENHRRFVVVGHSGPEPPHPNLICNAVRCP